MRWKSWNFSYKKEVKKKQWRKWLAWYPVVIAQEYPGYATCKHWTWFEWIERRTTSFNHYNKSWIYEYRAKEI